MADGTRGAHAVTETATPDEHHYAAGISNASDPAKTERDLICGMIADLHTTTYRLKHEGHSYYFCSAGCLANFIADPA